MEKTEVDVVRVLLIFSSNRILVWMYELNWNNGVYFRQCWWKLEDMLDTDKATYINMENVEMLKIEKRSKLQVL